jgi:hypothetical protein
MAADSQDAKLVFAQTLKRWFKSNGWPQAITDSWAKDPGIQAPSGPWASQICGAMKADFHPRVEFFLAMARFNQFVADQELRTVTVSKVRDRLKGALPLATDNGLVYGATEFFGLFTGLQDPPAAFAKTDELTQEDVDEWTLIMRDNFKKISLLHMCSRAEAWKMLTDEMSIAASKHGLIVAPDDFTWLQEVLIGLIDPTVADGIRLAQRTKEFQPVQQAMAVLLTPEESKKSLPIA